MLNRTISTADGFRYIAGVILALIVFFSIFTTDRWNQATLLRAALIYPPTLLLIAALFAPRRLSWVLRIVTGIFCGGVLCIVVFGMIAGNPQAATDRDAF